jgi:hypothetical protein
MKHESPAASWEIDAYHHTEQPTRGASTLYNNEGSYHCTLLKPSAPRISQRIEFLSRYPKFGEPDGEKNLNVFEQGVLRFASRLFIRTKA